MQRAVLVTVLSLFAGCVSAVPVQPPAIQSAPASVPPTVPPPAAKSTSVLPTSAPPPSPVQPTSAPTATPEPWPTATPALDLPAARESATATHLTASATAGLVNWVSYKHPTLDLALSYPAQWKVLQEDESGVVFQTVEDGTKQVAANVFDLEYEVCDLGSMVDEGIRSLAGVGEADPLPEAVRSGAWQSDWPARYREQVGRRSGEASSGEFRFLLIWRLLDSDRAALILASHLGSAASQQEFSESELEILHRVVSSVNSEQPADEGPSFAAVVGQDASARNGPGLQYDVIAEFRADDRVWITAQDSSRKWYRLESGAWISGELLELPSSPSIHLATVGPTATPMPATECPVSGFTSAFLGLGVDPSWLTEKVPRGEFLSHVCDAQRKAWEACLQTGDEFWSFDSGGKSWESMSGRAGYVVRRNGVIVGEMLERMN